MARHGALPATAGDGDGPLRTLLTAGDGVRIEAVRTPVAPAATRGSAAGSGGRAGAGPADAIVVAHGFTGSVDRPALRRTVAAFSRHVDVISFSFRGHGRSGGRSTVGNREVLDLAAAVRWARSLGYERVATVGFSMGGSVVLRHGALHRGDGGTTAADAVVDAAADAVVAVSAPARWYYRGTAPMRRLHWVVQRPVGRLVSRYGLRTRIHSEEWDPVPLSPVAAAPLIAPVPLLVVHGDADPYFPLDHPLSLSRAAGSDGAELWIERGFGHAENAADDALLDRIATWVLTSLPTAPGRG